MAEDKDDITKLTSEKLIARGLEADSDHDRRAVEFEMWRRDDLHSRHANLVALEVGKGGEAAGRWALTLALMALTLTLLYEWTTNSKTYFDGWLLFYTIITGLATVGSGLTLIKVMFENLDARARRRAFESEHLEDLPDFTRDTTDAKRRRHHHDPLRGSRP